MEMERYLSSLTNQRLRDIELTAFSIGNDKQIIHDFFALYELIKDFCSKQGNLSYKLLLRRKLKNSISN